MTLRPGKSCRKAGKKGQPEGFAIKSKAGKPRVEEAGLVSAETAGQNNSNPTPLAASAANGEWELFLTSSSHYCFIQLPYHLLHFKNSFLFLQLVLTFIFEINIIYMPYSGLPEFIADLEKRSEIVRINAFADPVLEITEITDRISKSGGKALLFTSNGTDFPILINAYGTPERMAMALGREDLDEPASEIISLFNNLSGGNGSLGNILKSIPRLISISQIRPSKSKSGGRCQQVIMKNPDLSVFPILKCWPHDGGRFITLPVVHTVNPFTGNTNAGMYRMQVLDSVTTGMHWQRHKTGARHFEEWKKTGKRMPVSVTLGGDPVYAYAATAPLPENIDEYLLAGFLRKRRVKLVKCLTNDLYVPSDADIVIEGYVDPSEEPVWEGPFGDHTGFYSLADWYPRLHVTCISHARDAVYPATIVGVPPMEDAVLTRATEKIFLAPLKIALLPEIIDFHMPDAGVAHNLVIVKIKKDYPGQGRKVINSLFGAGQMMFTKYMLVIDGEVNIRDYTSVAKHIIGNTDFGSDLLFTKGPLDVLDHSSDTFSFGGKLGIDATVKFQEERAGDLVSENTGTLMAGDSIQDLASHLETKGFRTHVFNGLPMLFVAADQKKERGTVDILKSEITHRSASLPGKCFISAMDINADLENILVLAWQILGNTDPSRDISIISGRVIFIDATLKVFSKQGFKRRWPNVVCSNDATISSVDARWNELGLGQPVISPSKSVARLSYSDEDEIKV